MDDDFFNRVFESKIVILLVIGVIMLVVSRIIKRGRTAEELPGPPEKVLWVGGMLVTLAALIYAGSRGCMVDVPEKEKEDMPQFAEESPGCSKPEKPMKDFEK